MLFSNMFFCKTVSLLLADERQVKENALQTRTATTTTVDPGRSTSEPGVHLARRSATANGIGLVDPEFLLVCWDRLETARGMF